MRSVAMTLLLAAMTAPAQAVLDDPAKIADAERLLETFQGEALRCDVEPLKPRFSFSLRLETGYVFHVPLSQYRGTGHNWIVVTRVTPQEGDRRPVYLSDVVELPLLSATDSIGDVSGSFWLGTGRYAVKSMLLDDSKRACRKEWQTEARLTTDQRRVEPLLAPNAVAGLTWKPAAKIAAPSPGRLTILLDAAPMSPARTVLSASDQSLLLDALSALVQAVPARAVRLVVFHLDLQKELFRSDDFTADAMPDVAGALHQLQPSVVDYGVLQKPEGALDLIEKMILAETSGEDPSRAVVFLGPRAHYIGKAPPGLFEQARTNPPRFFYLQCVPEPARLDSAAPLPRGGRRGFGRAGSGASPTLDFGMPDSIQNAVARLKGKTMITAFPEEFAKAVGQVNNAMRTSK
jgi:hypothetical protein